MNLAPGTAKNEWSEGRANVAAICVTLCGFLARLWMASGIFLNPDEALHFRLANQLSLAMAYKVSLTSAHPPLLILLLYCWRAFGTSELCLRMASVLAGTAFCWMFHKWLKNAAGGLTGLIGLLFVSFLAPVVTLSAELRQYELALAFMVSALYFLDEAFARNSLWRMAAFSSCLYLAMLTHYSSFLFAAALGVYALLEIRSLPLRSKIVAAWTISQILALGLALFLWKTHLSKLGSGESRSALQGWMSEYYLRKYFYDPARGSALAFLVSHTFAVFQFIFGHLVVGVIMGLLFLGAVALLLSGRGSSNRDPKSARRLGIFLLLPFAIAGGVCLAHFYPYGSTRHIAFLTIPAVAGSSLAIARIAAGRWERGLAIAALIVIVCVAFEKPHQPRMERADQSRAHMADAIQFVRQKTSSSDPIFVDYQTNLVLGHYLCDQRFIHLENLHDNFEGFSCDGHHVVSADYKTVWMFSPETFLQQWRNFVRDYSLHSGQTVWVFQVGWGVHLPEDLRSQIADFHDLRFEPFGQNIKIFKMTVGETLPDSAP